LPCRLFPRFFCRLPAPAPLSPMSSECFLYAWRRHREQSLPLTPSLQRELSPRCRPFSLFPVKTPSHRAAGRSGFPMVPLYPPSWELADQESAVPIPTAPRRVYPDLPYFHLSSASPKICPHMRPSLLSVSALSDVSVLI